MNSLKGVLGCVPGRLATEHVHSFVARVACILGFPRNSRLYRTPLMFSASGCCAPSQRALRIMHPRALRPVPVAPALTPASKSSWMP